MPDTPYVIGDFTAGDDLSGLPDNLIEIYDPRNGLILYKRISKK
jgi:hypothetical protein